MTCRQMGGPCDAEIKGNTADEVIKGGEKHIREMVAKGDESHKNAMRMMDDMRKNPQSGMDWYKRTQAEFAAAPDDQ